MWKQRTIPQITNWEYKFKQMVLKCVDDEDKLQKYFMNYYSNAVVAVLSTWNVDEFIARRKGDM